jgi:hypothetical protein
MAIDGATQTAKDELATFRGLRDPPPIRDGKDPAKRWIQKRRELKMWARDSDLPPSKLGVRLWRLGLPDGSPAKTLTNWLTDDTISAEDGFEIMMAAFDKAYAGFLNVTEEETFEKALFGQPRAQNEAFVEHTSRFMTEMHKYEVDEKTELPEKLKVRLLLRRATLTVSQRDRMETWAGRDADKLATNIELLNKLDHPRCKPGSVSATMN